MTNDDSPTIYIVEAERAVIEAADAWRGDYRGTDESGTPRTRRLRLWCRRPVPDV